MEEKKYPIIIKKKNSFMLMAVIAEFFIAGVYGIIQGFTSLLFLCFLFVAIVTLLAVWVEYSRDVYLRENKIEFYSNKDLIINIKYSSIVSLDVAHGEETKDKKKEFFTISYNETSSRKSKNKKPKIKKYYLNPSWYNANDFRVIKSTIKSKNPNIKIDENLKKYTKDK